MIPLVIEPCCRCGNADTSRFDRIGDGVRCLDCGCEQVAMQCPDCGYLLDDPYEEVDPGWLTDAD